MQQSDGLLFSCVSGHDDHDYVHGHGHAHGYVGVHDHEYECGHDHGPHGGAHGCVVQPDLNLQLLRPCRRIRM